MSGAMRIRLPSEDPRKQGNAANRAQAGCPRAKESFEVATDECGRVRGLRLFAFVYPVRAAPIRKSPRAVSGPRFRRLYGRIMDRLTLFGLFAVTAMLVCYALEDRSRWFVLAFAGACVLGSTYGFLQGAWPFGLVEGVWSVVAVRRWWTLDA